MRVVFVGRRQVIVDDVRDARDIEAARSDVGSDQHAHVILLEEPERLLAAAMGLVAMDALRRNARTVEIVRETLDTVLGAAEDEHLVELGSVREELYELRELVLRAYADDVLVDGVRRVASLYRYASRIIQEGTDERFDVARKGRREEERMALLRHRAHDLAHIADESHVEHAVSLVEYDGVEVRKRERTALHEVLEASRRTDDEVRITTQSAHLRLDASSSDAGYRVHVETLGEAVEFLFYLDGELARRHHDEHTLRTILNDLINERNEECRRLAGSGVRHADDILAIKDVRNGLVLDRSRVQVSLGYDVLLELLVYRKVDEGDVRHVCHDILRRLRLIDELAEIDIHLLMSALALRASARSSPTTTGII